MAESKIQWTRYTFNPWRGCTKVSPGCDHCYAETLSHRNPKVLGVWGDDGERVMAAESYWRAPLKWNAEAERTGVRDRVFCASLADVFEDRPELVEPRRRLLELIEETPNLDWLLLTKRPGNVRHMVPASWLMAWPSWAWIGGTAENQEQVVLRTGDLLRIPAGTRFLSCEPLLEPVVLAFKAWVCQCGASVVYSPQLDLERETCACGSPRWAVERIHWVIVGGESGSGARPMAMDAALSVIKQCEAAGVPVFCKQLGAHPTLANGIEFPMVHDPKKGGDPLDWPLDFKVRQFPAEA